jgi:hypothetical protein
VIAAAAIAGCGSSDRAAAPSTATTRTAPAPQAGGPPRGVPRQGTVPARPAVPAERAVIDRWLAILGRGDEEGAGRMFAPGALVQNGSPVLRLSTSAQRTQFMRILTCGATDKNAVAAPNHFTIVTFILTERPKGSCGSGTGHVASAAIQVRHGRITGWFRLPAVADRAGPQVKT